MARARKEVTIVKWLGHDDARARLAATIASERTAHAYLISGPEGIGKSAVAVEFARLLLCDQPTDKPCGVCPQCAALKTLHHPDLHLIAPSGSPKGFGYSGQRDILERNSKAAREQLVGNPYVSPILAELSTSESKGCTKKIRDRIKNSSCRFARIFAQCLSQTISGKARRLHHFECRHDGARSTERAY